MGRTGAHFFSLLVLTAIACTEPGAPASGQQDVLGGASDTGDGSGATRDGLEPDGACAPDCAGLDCGSDGCGGSCGTCSGGSCVAGLCVRDGCEPSCANAECGPDGCGGSCGGCFAGWDCKGGSCVDPGGPVRCGDGTCDHDESCVDCPADCGECGSASCMAALTCLLGCGAGDWDCENVCLKPATEVAADAALVLRECLTAHCGGDSAPGCEQAMMAPGGGCASEASACEGGCTPSCANRECGPDGCGGACGVCSDGLTCTGGVCAGAGATCADIVICGAGCSVGDEQCFVQCVVQGTEESVALFGELVGCVQQACGEGTPIHPQAPCSLDAMQGPCADIAEVCETQPGCVPWCGGKECGPDGCGGTCGGCPEGMSCSDAGVCGGGAVGCYDMLVCMSDCGTDECAYGCFEAGTPAAQSIYAELVDCLLSYCGEAGEPECYEQAVMGECGAIYEVCLSD